MDDEERIKRLFVLTVGAIVFFLVLVISRVGECKELPVLVKVCAVEMDWG